MSDGLQDERLCVCLRVSRQSRAWSDMREGLCELLEAAFYEGVRVLRSPRSAEYTPSRQHHVFRTTPNPNPNGGPARPEVKVQLREAT